MRATNWLKEYVRHSRTGDRKWREGRISFFLNKIKLETPYVNVNEYLEIELSDDEVVRLAHDFSSILKENQVIINPENVEGYNNSYYLKFYLCPYCKYPRVEEKDKYCAYCGKRIIWRPDKK